jgi:phosphoglycerol transferase MdoB-like AlkP superfamily enzyme
VRGGDLWFWADLPAALVLALAVSRFQSPRLNRLRLTAGSAAVVVVLAVVGFATLDRSIRLRQVFHLTHLARHIGVVNLHVADAGRTMLRATMGTDLSAAEHREVAAFFDRRRPLRSGSGPLYGAAEGRNLVMIQVESLQAFVVGLKIGDEEVTPFLNELAARSFAFDSVTDQTEEGRSSDSELATQVSLLPPNRGAAAFLYADNDYAGLASVLAAHGYATLSAVPFDGSFWNRRTTHRAYGYEQSLFADDFDPGESFGWGLGDRDFLAQAARRLVDLPEPWCAYLLTLSLHHPFDGFPDHLRRLDVGEWEGTPVGNFLHTMHYFDRALSDFISALDQTDLLEETVVALWGDHDAGFEWRPEIAELAGVTPDAAGWYVSQRVPLVISVPGIEGPVEALTVPAGHTDVAPTLLALLGIDPAPYAFLGRNLLGTPGTGPVVGEYRCWNDATHVYLRRGPRLSDGQCLDRVGLEEVAVDACATGFEDARRQVEVSELVLEHDLQRALDSARDE